jgi:hypothetical protein
MQYYHHNSLIKCQGAGAGRIRGAEWQLANGLLLRTGPQTDGQTV